MKSFALLAFVIPALAATTPLSRLIPRQVLSQLTVQEANSFCGDDQTISCCNSIKQGDDITQSSGILSGLLNGALSDGLALADDCSKINVAACKLREQKNIRI